MVFGCAPFIPLHWSACEHSSDVKRSSSTQNSIKAYFIETQHVT